MMACSGRIPLSILILLLVLPPPPAAAIRKSYIVYLGTHAQDSAVEASLLKTEEVAAAHREYLGSILGGPEIAQEAIFYSYSRVINGFAAMLTEDEVLVISESPAVKGVFPNRAHQLLTTRSWNFLGLETVGAVSASNLWTKARFGEDTIIGNIDSGVWPESASFRDKGYGPIPARWKGICDSGDDHTFSCNRKLIGARYYSKGYVAAEGPLSGELNSPRDIQVHGTHTLSIAGGNFVPGVNVYGIGNGTAKGGSPRARVSAYKVCWGIGRCYAADILAGFDAAIHDGVDVLSISIEGDPNDYFLDPIALGTFFAVKNSIAVICSAGNNGPSLGDVTNVAPWIFTVGASTIDRNFPAAALLGNGKRLLGRSLSSARIRAKNLLPLISSTSARAENANVTAAQLCIPESLDPKKVKGKIVACLRGINARVEKGETVLIAGGAGMILSNSPEQGDSLNEDEHFLPAVHLAYEDGLILYEYIASTRNPVATITPPDTVTNIRPSPVMAPFSSRGPNNVTAEILKPDITAPGVNVIAAYSPLGNPTGLSFDKRRLRYAFLTGTSMSCPHISGVVGLLKTLYPDWSPAAIKSAIMTTATTEDNLGNPILDFSMTPADPFSYGAGHPRPNLAMNPGLVYDLTEKDYLEFFCAIGYNSSQLAVFSEKFACPKRRPSLLNFNYPSISLPSLSGRTTVSRKVKNVGSPGTYRALVKPPPGISMKVHPKKMKFKTVGQVKKFNVTLQATRNAAISEYLFGTLTWSDGTHNVRSPVVVFVPHV